LPALLSEWTADRPRLVIIAFAIYDLAGGLKILNGNSVVGIGK